MASRWLETGYAGPPLATPNARAREFHLLRCISGIAARFRISTYGSEHVRFVYGVRSGLYGERSMRALVSRPLR
eukprot:1574534-Prymnesium_polylepis.1